MIEVVSSSLPFLVDKPTIRRVLEECKGNVDNAVSKILDSEDGSMSSNHESSSIERDQDSDDDGAEFSGPKKKQDRRMSRATKSLMKKSQEHRHQMASQFSANDGSQESLPGFSQLKVGESDDGKTRLQKATPDATDDEWRTLSVKGEDSDFSAIDSPKKGPRLKINPPKRMSSPSGVSKTQLKQNGPQRRRAPSAREKKDMKKQAQKAARKERAQAESKPNPSAGKPWDADVTLHMKETQQSPIQEGYGRTIYI